MISLIRTFQPNALSPAPCVFAGKVRIISNNNSCQLLSTPNKGFSSRFCVGSRVRHETPEEGQRTYRSKLCDYNNKDEVKNPNILNDNNNDNNQMS